MKLDIAHKTASGGKQDNQDCCDYMEKDNTYCLLVSDGVGGYQYGECASRLVVQAMKQSFSEQPTADEAILRMHMEAAARYIAETIRENPAMAMMRTTLAAIYAGNERIVAGHVGDSRIYIFSDQSLLYRSQDHSVVMQMVQNQELHTDEVRGHPKRNIITSAIGATPPKKLNTISFDGPFSPGDGILLCSDGFWELLTKSEMMEALRCSVDSAHWLNLMEQRVGNRLSANSDNYTCLVARVLRS